MELFTRVCLTDRLLFSSVHNCLHTVPLLATVALILIVHYYTVMLVVF